jgi:DNA-binding NtrC family response regulator
MRRSIFYFDDEQNMVDLFQDMFGGIYEVHTAITLAEARRILAECAVDIIISDRKMPEIEGVEFLKEAATVCPDSFRILLTGQAVILDVLTEIRTGIIHLFVTKPWTEERMREVLERAIATLDLHRQEGRQDGPTV